MKAYILRRKNTPAYSVEDYVVLANNKKELRAIVEKGPYSLNLKEFNVTPSVKPAVIYTNIV